MADPDFPDIYADSAAVSLGAYGVAITLFLSDPLADQPFQRTVGRIRMSVDLAEAMNDLLGKQLAKARPRPATRRPKPARKSANS